MNTQPAYESAASPSFTMPIAIFPPHRISNQKHFKNEVFGDVEQALDSQGDVSMYEISVKNHHVEIVTPGETVTSDPQWMRGHGTYLSGKANGEESGGRIIATVLGTVQKVNKLLSVKPLRARYSPEIGDLVVGRIVEVGLSRLDIENFID